MQLRVRSFRVLSRIVAIGDMRAVAGEQRTAPALTAWGSLAGGGVPAMREAMEWRGCACEERRRAGKVLNEWQVGELHLVRALIEEAGLVESPRKCPLRPSWKGNELLAVPKGALRAAR